MNHLRRPIFLAALLLTLTLSGNAQVLSNVFGKSPRELVFTASGSWTAPSGVTSVTLEAQAPGGGGGSGSYDGQGGGGGGSGEWKRLSVPVTPGATYTVTIGAAGTGGAGVGSPGSNSGVSGGSITFGSLFTARGGIRGFGGSTSSGAGGSRVGNTLGSFPPWTADYFPGLAGGNAEAEDGEEAPGTGTAGAGASAGDGGGGAASKYGNGGSGGTNTGTVNGSAATGYGAGGGGGAENGLGTSGSGGNGAPGFLIVRWIQ